jgi:arabinose-5-phosphate isomerase
MNFTESAKRTIQLELEAIAGLSAQIDSNFSIAASLCVNCQGRVVVSGMGKSGHIGRKISATLASTGTPSFFMHPADASHGDLGMLTGSDVVLALSNSGASSEILELIPTIKRRGIPLLSITGDSRSKLALASDAHLSVRISKEACPLNLAPTSSTTAALVMGDALAIALLEARGFSHEDFAFSHPGGALGRKLILKVDDIMHSGISIPKVTLNATILEALIEMTDKKLGITTVVDPLGQLAGVFSDGDLRRALESGKIITDQPVKEYMTQGGAAIALGSLAAEAVRLMQEQRVNAIVVTDQDGLAGVLNMHDLLQAGVV